MIQSDRPAAVKKTAGDEKYGGDLKKSVKARVMNQRDLSLVGVFLSLNPA